MGLNRVAIYTSANKKPMRGNFIKGDNQLIREYCIYEGSTVVAVYEDIDINSKSIENRTGLRKMLADSKNNLFDEVIVWESIRITKNIQELVEISKILKKNDVILSSMIEPFGFAEMKTVS
ncbi:Resolvase, N terminal domain [Anaerovirgula multivorans]|uniref:Resolvase, N terminal domain n=1 Tax=Anaerovirgula multivorans TaxID=312168 RepID=A0A239KMT5_9FIRM|nr:recombinase family protein [Anaerovirgula multivorans]SNT19365.1 Resolvase, N terminal domain [Anaerovirgula multivorans]